MVSIILDYLQAGEPREEILRQYPTLKPADIDAALGYAAWLAHEEEIHPLHTELYFPRFSKESGRLAVGLTA